MDKHTDGAETYLLQMISKLKTNTFNEENLKSVTNILIQMTEMKSFGLMAQFLEKLEDVFVAELKRCPQTFFCLAHMKLHFNQFQAVYEMIKNVGAEMQGDGEALIQLWNATLYKEAETVRGKELNSLKKFRLRSRKPPPVHICPNGARPTNSLPQHATVTLWRWALQHAYRLYPTRDERCYLEQEAGLTAYQVKTWFANVRRRIKKCGARTIMEKKKTKYDIKEVTAPEVGPDISKRHPNTLAQQANSSSAAFLTSCGQKNVDRPTSQRSSMYSKEIPASTLTSLTNMYQPSLLPDCYSCGDELGRTVTPQLSEALVPSTHPYNTFRNEPYNVSDTYKRSATPAGTVDIFPDIPQCAADRACGLNTPSYVPDYRPLSQVNLNHSSYTPLDMYPIGPVYATQSCKNPFPLPIISHDPLASLLRSETPTYCLPSFGKDVYQGYYQTVPWSSSYPINSLCSSFGCNLNHSFGSSSNCFNPKPGLNISCASSTMAGFTEPSSRPLSQTAAVAKQNPEKKPVITAMKTTWSCEGESSTKEELMYDPLGQPRITKVSETRKELYGKSMVSGGQVEELSATVHKSDPDSNIPISKPGQYDMLRHMLQQGTSVCRPDISTHPTINPFSKQDNTNCMIPPIESSTQTYMGTRKPKASSSWKNKMTKISRRQHHRRSRTSCTSGAISNGDMSEIVTVTSSSLHVPTSSSCCPQSMHNADMVSLGGHLRHPPEQLMPYNRKQSTSNSPCINGISCASSPVYCQSGNPTSPTAVCSLGGYLQNPDRITSSVREQLPHATLLTDSPTKSARTKEELLPQPPGHNEKLINSRQTLNSSAHELQLSSQNLNTKAQELLSNPPAKVLFTRDSHCGRQVSERGGILHLSPEANRSAKTRSCSTVPQQKESSHCTWNADRPSPPATALWPPNVLNKDSLSDMSMSGHNNPTTAQPDDRNLWQVTPFSPRLPDNVKDSCAVVSGSEVPGMGASSWPCVPSASTSLPLLPPTPQWTPVSPPATIAATYNTTKAVSRVADTRGGGVLSCVPSYPNLHLARPPYPTPRQDSLGSSPRSSLSSEPPSMSPYTQPDEQEVVEALLHLSNYSMPNLPNHVFYSHTVDPPVWPINIGKPKPT